MWGEVIFAVYLPTAICSDAKKTGIMKSIILFYLKDCPYCKKAFRYISELTAEHPELAQVPITAIEESEQPEVADKYDYYYVPTFYIGTEKAHEAGIFKPEVEALLRKALNA